MKSKGVRNTPYTGKQCIEVQRIVQTTRRKLGLTQGEFAKLFSGYSPDVVKNWERGRTLPRADVFLKILRLHKRILHKERGTKAAKQIG